jgi:hypothetical protein
MTGQPVAGLGATITARRVHSLTTGSDGTFSQDDLAGGTVNIAIRNGSSPTIYHHVNDPFVLRDDNDILYELIPYQPSPSPLIDNTLQLFREAATGLGTGSVLRKWRSLPVDVYVPTFVNTRGVDYTERSLAAIERWELRTGVDLFRLVDAPPESGVDVQFLPRSVMGIQNGVTVHHQDGEGYPSRNEVRVIDEFGDPMQLYRVMLHELGHTIRLNHLPAGFIMYAGQPLPDDITDDEALVVQLHSALPNDFNIAPYDPGAPTP